MAPESEYLQEQALWDSFLEKWPLEQLESMTLYEYSEAGDTDTFMYWLEHKLKVLGNILGGSAFKFGVFSRKDKGPKENKYGRIYELDYAFWSKLGSTSQEAFETVKRAILSVAFAARRGDLEVIEKETVLAPVVKWKIAFLYQNPTSPICPAIYADDLLREVAGVDAKASHLDALRTLMSGYNNDGSESIFAFSKRCWEKVQQWVYPEFDPGISKETWLELLQNPQIATEEALMLLAQMRKLGGSASCSDLTKSFGRSIQFYISVAASLGKRVAESQSIELVEDEGSGRYWVIPFVGRKLDAKTDSDHAGVFLWKFRTPLAEALAELSLPDVFLQQHTDDHDSAFEKEVMPMDEIDEIVQLLQVKKNLILQGAPGTGKTYHIPEIVTRLCGVTKAGDSRQTVMQAYAKLKAAGRVDFTTFHPSLDYENFVQGWQPVVSDDSDAEIEAPREFEISEGIFKRISDAASLGVTKEDEQLQFIPGEQRVWKVSLAGSYDNPIRTDCLRKNRIRIDWGGDQEDIGAIIETRQPGYKTLNAFCNRMKKGDFVVSCYSQTQTDAIGIVESDFYRLPENGFRLTRDVRWIWKGKPTEITKEFMDGYVFTLNSVYSITKRFTPTRIREFLERQGVLREKREFPPFVLAIDEINRGNVSKIFGELITLLEADKRKDGIDEESCRLPFSKAPFFVPPNLYIIATMNTADRSIGTIDYALRRRFVFYPLKPRPINDERFDTELFRAISNLFVEDPDAERSSPNYETLSEEFDPLDVWPGPSYFLMERKTRPLRYRYEIRPLLMEYLRDGVLKPLAKSKIREIEEKFGL